MNLRRALVLGSTFMLLTGCYADVDSFVVARAKFDCKRIKECNRSLYVDAYDEDMGRCRSELEDTYFDLVDLAERAGWDYDPEAGRECIAARRGLKKDCSNDADEEIVRACRDVDIGGF